MKEFGFMYDEGLRIGLIPSEKVRRNQPGLYEAYNVRVEKEGIAAYIPIVDPFTHSLTFGDWPFPQLFYTKRGIVLAGQTALYSVNSSTFALTSLITGQQAGNLWTLADYDTYQIWTNGVVVVYRDVVSGTYGSESLMTHVIESVCDYNGQVIAGNLGTDKKNWVAWSEIGNVVITNLLSVIGVGNTKGYMPMAFPGAIYQVKKLGKGVMVYGADGIAYLPATHTTFGRVDMFEFGIGGKGWIGGNDKIHLFIDTYGFVHTIDSTLKHITLGYSNYINDMDNDIVVTYDALKNDFYISDGHIGFILTSTDSDSMSMTASGFKSSNHVGLSEIFQCVSGLFRIGGNLYGYSFDGLDLSAYITTNTFNMQTRGIKTIQSVESSINSISAQGAIDYIFASNESYVRSTLKNINKQGTFMPMISGTDFRVHIKVADYTDFFVDMLSIKYKMSDKRNIRGAYGEPKNL